MKIELHNIKISDLVNGYKNEDENGVVGYFGKLNIRPPYQREFIYEDAEMKAVINTVLNGFPLNIMYWCKSDDGSYELLDGQQRTLSICKFFDSDFSINYKGSDMYFHNFKELDWPEYNAFLDYELSIYICEGSNDEKLDWFKTINIAGKDLSDQELRNAIYHGSWVSDAKRYFSKNNCAAYRLAKNYVNKKLERQEYLELAIKWYCDIDGISIEDFMALHQNDSNACDLWDYFQEVIDWVKRVFSTPRNEMKGLDWGILYNKYKDKSFNSADVELKISELYKDDDVTSKRGIYTYILSGEEKYLNIRQFTNSQKAQAFEKCGGVCAKCGKQFKLEEMHADHIMPWSKGGKTEMDNCQMLCSHCNAAKSNKY